MGRKRNKLQGQNAGLTHSIKNRINHVSNIFYFLYELLEIVMMKMPLHIF